MSMKGKPRAWVNPYGKKSRINFKIVSEKKLFEFLSKKTYRKKQLTEIAPKSYHDMNPGVSVKKIGKGKDYLARATARVAPKRHEFQHARQAVFHHEHQFQLNGRSVLAEMEQELFYNLLNKTLNWERKKRETRKTTLNDLRELFRTARTPIDQTYNLDVIYGLKRLMITALPKDRRKAIKVLIKLFRDQKMRRYLRILNRIHQYKIQGKQYRSNQGRTLRALKPLLQFVKENSE